MSAVGWVERLRNPSSAFASAVLPDTGAAVHLVRAGYDAQGAVGFCRGEGGIGWDSRSDVTARSDATKQSTTQRAGLLRLLAMNNAWA
jgi:hypothetical protein